jgi:hypothetical protein
LNSALSGLTSTTSPFEIEKPAGWFIQPLTAITMNEPVTPAITMGIPARKCVRRGRRSQPYT